MFFSVFGQTPKHVFLSVLGSASDPKWQECFQCFWSDPKSRVFECFSEVLYCFCHLGLKRKNKPRGTNRNINAYCIPYITILQTYSTITFATMHTFTGSLLMTSSPLLLKLP